MCESFNTLGRYLKKLCHLNNGSHRGVPEESFTTWPMEHCGEKRQCDQLLCLTVGEGAESLGALKRLQPPPTHTHHFCSYLAIIIG